jgi:hypothetical protein
MHPRRPPRPLLCLALLALASLLAACGDSSDDDASDAIPVDSTDDDGGSTTTGASTSDADDDDETDVGDAELVADACSLLDADLIGEALDGVESIFGALTFNEPLATGPSDFCTWPEAGGGVSLSITVEDASSAETDDHSGRAYNIDVEPIVEPQDGPGTKAVLLRDDAFEDGTPITYGYFFVEGDVAVFIEATGFDAGVTALRTLADEADARLLAG